MGHSLIGQAGVRYSNPESGQDSRGFDCSGFICHLIAEANSACGTNLQPPRHANEQFRKFGEPIHYRQRIPGDLVYFPSRRKGGMRIIGHVGLVVASDTYIHSPGKDNTYIEAQDLPVEPIKMPDVTPNDIYTHTPAGIKRLAIPIGTGRWLAH